jgi:hypothetical protein
MTSYYENLDRLIEKGDLNAIDEVLSLCENGDEEAIIKLLAVKEARELRECPIVSNLVDPELGPITMTAIVVREEKI